MYESKRGGNIHNHKFRLRVFFLFSGPSRHDKRDNDADRQRGGLYQRIIPL